MLNEREILNKFKEFVDDDVDELDLIVADDDIVMESRDNGKVWAIEYDEDGNIVDVYEVQ